MRNGTIFLVVILPLSMGIATAETTSTTTKTIPAGSVDAEYKRAIEFSHNDKHDEALAILGPLTAQYPDNYPIRRDYVVISAWKGDCDESLKKYESIKNRSNKEPYLVTAVSECMAKTRRHDEALSLLQEGKKNHPNDKDIQSNYSYLVKAIDLDKKPQLDLSAGTNESDAGNREYFFSAKYSHQIADATRAFVRYYTTAAEDKEFDTEGINRVGVGVMHWFNPKWYGEQEFSKEIKHGGDTGSTTTIIHHPTSLWEFRGQYASFTEDVPLRAKELNIDADRLTLAVDYHSIDYKWEWSASYSTYDFSDGNDRDTFYTALGYGYVMESDLEERIIFGLFRSSNSLLNTVYYNPESDTSITVTNRTSLVIDSQFKRHVDHISLYIGRYNQQGYSAKFTYGARYEQEYELNDYQYFSWGAEYASLVFDGERESIVSLVVNFSTKFL